MNEHNINLQNEARRIQNKLPYYCSLDRLFSENTRKFCEEINEDNKYSARDRKRIIRRAIIYNERERREDTFLRKLGSAYQKVRYFISSKTQISREEAEIKIRQSLSEMTQDHKNVFLLYYGDSLSLMEIALALDLSVHRVEGLYRESLQEIRKQIKSN